MYDKQKNWKNEEKSYVKQNPSFFGIIRFSSNSYLFGCSFTMRSNCDVGTNTSVFKNSSCQKYQGDVPQESFVCNVLWRTEHDGSAQFFHFPKSHCFFKLFMQSTILFGGGSLAEMRRHYIFSFAYKTVQEVTPYSGKHPLQILQHEFSNLPVVAGTK